jgi:hypothetical protein
MEVSGSKGLYLKYPALLALLGLMARLGLRVLPGLLG